MQEHPGAVTFKGNPLTLLGPERNVGDDAPDATVIDNDLNEVRLGSYKGKIVVLTSVPSLDTPVCDTMTRTFNKEATELSENVVVLTISMDLPFAQARWCGNHDIENVETLSDHRDAAFGEAWGLLVKELRLLARSVWVVNADGDIVYKELVTEIADEPQYDKAIEAVRQLTDGS
jgi:thiol peroxidase